MQKVKFYRAIEDMATDGKKIRGTALVFDSWSKDLGGFRELIHREAVTPSLIEQSDIQLNVDHDPTKMLARSKYGNGSLRLFITDRGLEFETDVPDTQLGHDMVVMLERKDYSQCSFCFTLPDNYNGYWHRDASDNLVREIERFDKLWDVSIVYNPAYDETEASARQMRSIAGVMDKMTILEKSIETIYCGRD